MFDVYKTIYNISYYNNEIKYVKRDNDNGHWLIIFNEKLLVLVYYYFCLLCFSYALSFRWLPLLLFFFIIIFWFLSTIDIVFHLSFAFMFQFFFQFHFGFGPITHHTHMHAHLISHTLKTELGQRWRNDNYNTLPHNLMLFFMCFS